MFDPISYLMGAKAGSSGSAASGENLLCNWEFSNPVNTRGQSTYSAAGTIWTIDGWNSFQGSTEILTGGLLFNRYSATYGYAVFQQRPNVNFVTAMLDKTFTLSALVESATDGLIFGFTTFTITSATGDQHDPLNVDDKFFYYYRDSNTIMTFNIFTDQLESTTKVVAVKVEAGSAQTLCHQEGDLWVLNEHQNADAEYVRVRAMVANS